MDLAKNVSYQVQEKIIILPLVDTYTITAHG